jgi:cardiolipin synthase
VLHAKVLLIDESWVMVGSANLDQRSFHRNYELNVVVDSHDFGAQVADMLTTDLKGARRIVPDETKEGGGQSVFWNDCSRRSAGFCEGV